MEAGFECINVFVIRITHNAVFAQFRSLYKWGNVIFIHAVVVVNISNLTRATRGNRRTGCGYAWRKLPF